MDPLKETFTRSERLCSKKDIAELFERGNSFYSFPFQIVWLESSADMTFPARIAVSVSKKLFKRSVKRNLIKRRIKEVYRKKKHTLYSYLEKENLRINFMIIFKGETITDYAETEKSLIKTLEKLITELEKMKNRNINQPQRTLNS